MKSRLLAVLVALATVFGIALGAAPAASANDGAFSRIVNHSAYTITGGFMGTQMLTLNIAPGSWQGEVYGNKNYEPRNLHIRSQWCMEYHFQVYPTSKYAPGATNRVCAPSNVYPIGSVRVENIYFGDGNTNDYDVIVTAYW